MNARRAAWLCAAFAPACANINPTLVAARTLPRGRFAVDLGSAYAAPVAGGTLDAARAAADRLGLGTPSPGDPSAYATGAAGDGQLASGVGTYLLARAGLGADVEAQLGLVGRVFRVGARRMFWSNADGLAVSLGLQGRIGPLPGLMGGVLPGLDLREGQVYGSDVQLLFGKNNSDLYDVWAGLRVGYTRANGVLASDRLQPGTTFGASADRLEGAVTVGLKLGLGHFVGMIELEAQFGYQWTRTTPVNGVAYEGGAAFFGLVPGAGVGFQF